MSRNNTKLSLAMVAALAFVTLGITSIHSPTWAQEPGGGPLACADGEGAFFDSNAKSWECGDIIGPDKIVFLSSETTVGDIGGLEGADLICNDLAFTAGLQLAEDSNYKAWLSSRDASASGRLIHHPGRYVLLDGTIVAYEWDDLTNANLNNLIDRDETGALVPGETEIERIVWTSTETDGSYVGTDMKDCVNWTSGGSDVDGFTGDFSELNQAWTYWTRARCNFPARLYCFEQ